jgi:hypothetical protein
MSLHQRYADWRAFQSPVYSNSAGRLKCGLPLSVVELGRLSCRLAIQETVRTAGVEAQIAGGRPIEVTRVRITDAGQRTHEDRTPTHGYAATREAAMTAFGKSWRRE